MAVLTFRRVVPWSLKQVALGVVATSDNRRNDRVGTLTVMRLLVGFGELWIRCRSDVEGGIVKKC